jgi:hypothetical protein
MIKRLYMNKMLPYSGEMNQLLEGTVRSEQRIAVDRREGAIDAKSHSELAQKEYREKRDRDVLRTLKEIKMKLDSMAATLMEGREE